LLDQVSRHALVQGVETFFPDNKLHRLEKAGIFVANLSETRACNFYSAKYKAFDNLEGI
jgi:hypothetical protein